STFTPRAGCYALSLHDALPVHAHQPHARGDGPVRTLDLLPTHVGMDLVPERCRKTCSVFPTHVGIPSLGGFVSVPGSRERWEGERGSGRAPPFCLCTCCAGQGYRWSTDDGFPGVGATCRNASVGSGGLGSGGNGDAVEGASARPWLTRAAEERARVPGPPRRRLTVRLPMPCPGIAGSAAGWTL